MIFYAYVAIAVLSAWPISQALIRFVEGEAPSLPVDSGDRMFGAAIGTLIAALWPIVAFVVAAFWFSRWVWRGVLGGTPGDSRSEVDHR